MKLSATQIHVLATLARDWSRGGSALVSMDNNCTTHMPYNSEVRTYHALEDKGLIEYCGVEKGFQHNGYRITDKGREELLKRPIINS